jgi:alpha,alpha-trehalose phosphorylase
MHLRPDAFSAEQKARNFAYYEPLTVRDSSLSACTQAVISAEVGQLGLARDYLAEAALIDLRDVQHNTSDGVHMASLAGAWMALVAGFGGMRAGAGPLTFSPRLPGGISQLRFRLRYRGRKLRVTITPGQARYELLDGEPMAVVHHGNEFKLGERASEHDIPQVKAGPRPAQPARRAPQPAHEPISLPPHLELLIKCRRLSEYGSHCHRLRSRPCFGRRSSCPSGTVPCQRVRRR